MSEDAIKIELNRIVEEKLATLRLRSFASLASLPAIENTDSLFEGRKISITVYRDNLESGELRVVAQALTPGRWLTTRISAQGFRVAQSGGVIPLSPEDLWGFS